MHQVGTSSLLIYMMHGHTYIKYIYDISATSIENEKCFRQNL